MALKLRFRAPVLAWAIAGAVGLTGYTIDNSKRITWSYFTTATNLVSNPTGSTTAVPYNTGTGLPTYASFTSGYPAALNDSKLALPADFITRIGLTLPEGVSIASSGKVPGGLAGDAQTNITLKANADVWVTFLNETAGFANSVGFFVYDPANPPTSRSQITSDQIILPNVSVPSPLTKAGTQGQTVYLGKIPAGKAVGFFVAANGWTTSGRTNPANGPKIAGVNEKISTDWIFYSLRGLNAEASASYLNQHTILLDDTTLTDSGGKTYERLVLGFEDYLRNAGSDHDFNDVVMAVHVSPANAVDTTNYPKLLGNTDPDSDGDGVKDSLDEFPNDPTAASSRWPLGQGTWGTLAYEDRWPSKGDYDLNDMVVRYYAQEILDASGKVSRVALNFRLDARGGRLHSGFALALPGITASQIASAQLTTGSGAPAAINPLFSGANTATFELFKDAFVYTPDSGTSNSCQLYYNTGAGCPKQPSTEFKLLITLNSATASFPAAPYDPFIFRSDVPGIEIHLPGMQPSARADASYFKTQDDKSVPGTSYTYMDANRQPWALHLPKEWAYPSELVDVVQAYSTIVDWASSGGTSSTSWYTAPTDATKTYTGQ